MGKQRKPCLPCLAQGLDPPLITTVKERIKAREGDQHHYSSAVTVGVGSTAIHSLTGLSSHTQRCTRTTIQLACELAPSWILGRGC